MWYSFRNRKYTNVKTTNHHFRVYVKIPYSKPAKLQQNLDVRRFYLFLSSFLSPFPPFYIPFSSPLSPFLLFLSFIPSSSLLSPFSLLRLQLFSSSNSQINKSSAKTEAKSISQTMENCIFISSSWLLPSFLSLFPFFLLRLKLFSRFKSPPKWLYQGRGFDFGLEFTVCLLSFFSRYPPLFYDFFVFFFHRTEPLLQFIQLLLFFSVDNIKLIKLLLYNK